MKPLLLAAEPGARAALSPAERTSGAAGGPLGDGAPEPGLFGPRGVRNEAPGVAVRSGGGAGSVGVGRGKWPPSSMAE